MPRAFYLLLSLVFFGSATARAAGVCDYYRANAPALYDLVCKNRQSGSRPAGASSSFSSAFNLSAASLPSEPSSYGLEVIGSYLRKDVEERTSTFSIVKGFTKFGTGISTGSNNTFYGDDVLQRRTDSPELQTFDPPEKPKKSIPNLNIGTSFKLAQLNRGPSLKLGVSFRYNRISDSWGGGPALAVNFPYLTLGVAATRERISNELPRIQFTSYQVSTRLWLFEFEYNRLLNDSDFRQSPIHIYTITATVKKLVITGALRNLEYQGPHGDQAFTQRHFAFQYLFSKAFSGGLLYNYIPGAASLGMQFFL